MDSDQSLGYVILLGSLAGIVVYLWLLFFTLWSLLVLQVSAMLAVSAVLVIMAWIGYTLITTPPPMPLDDFDFDDELGLDDEEADEPEETGETGEKA